MLASGGDSVQHGLPPLHWCMCAPSAALTAQWVAWGAPRTHVQVGATCSAHSRTRACRSGTAQRRTPCTPAVRLGRAYPRGDAGGQHLTAHATCSAHRRVRAAQEWDSAAQNPMYAQQSGPASPTPEWTLGASMAAGLAVTPSQVQARTLVTAQPRAQDTPMQDGVGPGPLRTGVGSLKAEVAPASPKVGPPPALQLPLARPAGHSPTRKAGAGPRLATGTLHRLQPGGCRPTACVSCRRWCPPRPAAAGPGAARRWAGRPSCAWAPARCPLCLLTPRRPPPGRCAAAAAATAAAAAAPAAD